MAKVCVIRQWHYPNDPRVSKEVQALAAAGHDVDVICAIWPGQARFERIGRVTVYRIPIARRRAGLLRYAFELTTFQIAATLLAGFLHLRRRYDVVQVNSLPDWLVFAALVPKLLGARVILDLHECMPEYFATKYKLPLQHPVVRLFMLVERASIRFADFAITCTEQMREKFAERGTPSKKIGVVLNSLDESRFDPSRYSAQRTGGNDFVLVYHGTIDENFGLDLLIRAVALLRDRIPDLRLRVYGEGIQLPEVQALTRELGLEDRVWFSGHFYPPDQLLRCIGEADAGVVPIRRDPFRDLTHSNKMYDLISMRKPVIISRTRAVEAYFGDECFQLFESGDEADLARAIEKLHADPGLRERLVQRATEVSQRYRWMYQSKLYLDAVERLVPRRAAAQSAAPAVVAEAVEER